MKRKNPGSGVDLHIGNRKKHFDTEAEAYRYALDSRRGGLHSEFSIVDMRTGIRREFSRAGKRRNPKSNPESGAVKMREAFTGLPSEGTILVTDDIHVHEHLALLGPLVELRVKPQAGSEKGYAFDIDFSRQANPRKSVLGAIDKTAAKVGKPIKGWVGRRAKAISGIVSGIGKTWINPTKLNSSGQPLLCSNEKGTHMYIEGGNQSLDLGKLGLGKMDKESVVIGPVTYLVYHARKKFDGKEEEHDYRHRLSEEDIGPLPTLRYDIMNRRLYLDGGSYHIPKPFFGTSGGITN